MTREYDIIIIGGGNAGFGASAPLAEAGKRIAFIEELDFGGTCPNRGCTPKKVLVAAAASLDTIAKASAHGISVGDVKLDWKALIERKNDMISFIPGAMGDLAAKRGDVYRGHARFTGRNSVRVGDTELTAEHIIIATGSKTRPLPIPGAELLMTSDDVLSDTHQPESVVFIGGGVIALEFSHVYARAGTQVTILELAPQLLPRLDADAVAMLQAETERLGVEVHTGVGVNEVRRADDGLEVVFEKDGETIVLAAERVINGAGRMANVDTLDLDKAGITHDGIRIEIHPHLQSTSNPAIWVAGDALVHTAQLSPFATHEGQIVARNILTGSTEAPDYFAVPNSVYTVPSFASVGLTETQAQESIGNLRVAVNDMTGWLSGKSYAESLAWSKILIDEDSDQIVGAHLLGHHADDIIHILSFAMKHRVSVSEIKSTIFAYPSFSSDIKNLL
ncbi:dihydrolipoyl dehydrogenase family protein [Maricaulis sp. MIT060901]|uniref:dihydrolipoyl dehydrogenase family protein n=1 Tax=Maricaulis sp. MIT060901 TaxID=3096993 RepID=UPI00399B8420